MAKTKDELLRKISDLRADVSNERLGRQTAQISMEKVLHDKLKLEKRFKNYEVMMNNSMDDAQLKARKYKEASAHLSKAVTAILEVAER